MYLPGILSVVGKVLTTVMTFPNRHRQGMSARLRAWGFGSGY